MNKLIFGPAIDSSTGNETELLNYLKKALIFSDKAVELSFTSVQSVVFNQEIIDVFNKFEYKSIHLPVVDKTNGTKRFLKYPDQELNSVLKVIDKIIIKTSPDTVLIHPDQVVDFSWVISKYARIRKYGY
jgi:hypothetical protein